MENEVRGGEREEERDEEEREAVTDDSDDLNTQLNEQERLMASFAHNYHFLKYHRIMTAFTLSSKIITQTMLLSRKRTSKIVYPCLQVY